jgi:hypothetical protein
MSLPSLRKIHTIRILPSSHTHTTKTGMTLPNSTGNVQPSDLGLSSGGWDHSTYYQATTPRGILHPEKWEPQSPTPGPAQFPSPHLQLSKMQNLREPPTAQECPYRPIVHRQDKTTRAGGEG